MNCRNPKCGAELVPLMVTEMGATEETQWKRIGELAWECPNGCMISYGDTESWQKQMKEKPQPRIPKPAL